MGSTAIGSQFKVRDRSSGSDIGIHALTGEKLVLRKRISQGVEIYQQRREKIAGFSAIGLGSIAIRPRLPARIGPATGYPVFRADSSSRISRSPWRMC